MPSDFVLHRQEEFIAELLERQSSRHVFRAETCRWYDDVYELPNVRIHFLPIVQHVVPSVHQEEEAHLPWSVVLERLLDGDEILQALRHLQSGDLQRTAVEEVVHPLIAVEVGLALKIAVIREPIFARSYLSDFVVVMRELEVQSSRMNV